MSDVTIQDNPAENRYEVLVDGELAGFADYRLLVDENRIDFTHTEVFEQFGGQGLAGKLAKGSLDEVRTRGLAVRPYCPFYKGWIQKHPEYVDLVPEDQREKFELV